MARLFFADIPEYPTCASCGVSIPTKRLYDDYKDRYFCDMDCLAEYISENSDEVAEDYAETNICEEE